MKTALLVLCLLFTTAAFGQYGGAASYISNEPQIYQSPSHPAHASVQPLAQEQSVLAGTNYSSARGERPTWDLPQAHVVPLGDTARLFRKEHARLRKARIILEN